MKNGNAAILKHRETQRALRVFRGAGGTVEYLGEFEVDIDRPYDIAQAPETGGGRMRNVIIFNLQPVERIQVAILRNNTAKVVPLEAHSTERTVMHPCIETKEVVRRESALVRRFAEWLNRWGVKAERLACSVAGEEPGSQMYSDIYVKERQHLIEAKGVVTREGIRMAIGQLLDYRRFAPPGTRLAVLLPRPPGPDLEMLLTSVDITCIWQTKEAEFADNANGAFVLGTEDGRGRCG